MAFFPRFREGIDDSTKFTLIKKTKGSSNRMMLDVLMQKKTTLELWSLDQSDKFPLPAGLSTITQQSTVVMSRSLILLASRTMEAGHVLLSAKEDPNQVIFRKVRGYVSYSRLIAPFIGASDCTIHWFICLHH